MSRNDEIIIEDNDEGFMKSVHELIQDEFVTAAPGHHIWERKFTNGSLRTPTAEYKIDGIKITYTGPSILTTQRHIDFTKHISAILEYIGETSQKFIVTREGKKLPDADDKPPS